VCKSRIQTALCARAHRQQDCTTLKYTVAAVRELSKILTVARQQVMAPKTGNANHGAYTDAEHGSDMPAFLCPAAVLVATFLLIMLATHVVRTLRE
jgi:hypothetical protein